MANADKRGSDSNPRLVGLSRAGYRALEKRRLDEAARYFDQMLEIDPANSYALVGHAELARKRLDVKAALGRYLACLDGDPKNRFALKGAAECAWELRDYRRSVELWQAYLAVTAADATVLAHVGDGHRKLGNSAESEAAYRRALEVEPDNRYALNGMGNLLYDAERYEEAAAAWDRLLAFDQKNVRVLVCLGNCHRKLKDFETALERFTAAARFELVASAWSSQLGPPGGQTIDFGTINVTTHLSYSSFTTKPPAPTCWSCSTSLLPSPLPLGVIPTPSPSSRWTWEAR